MMMSQKSFRRPMSIMSVYNVSSLNPEDSMTGFYQSHLVHDRDRAVHEVEELRQKREQMLFDLVTSMYLDLSPSELEFASKNFSSSLMIGEGAFGCVYRGVLTNMTVAIKVLKPDSLQGRS
jgi:hypothetical protein